FTFKLFFQLSFAEITQVASVIFRGAVGIFAGEIRKILIVFQIFQNLFSFAAQFFFMGITVLRIGLDGNVTYPDLKRLFKKIDILLIIILNLLIGNIDLIGKFLIYIFLNQTVPDHSGTQYFLIYPPPA